ncbi:hypothetical protein ASG56_15705 [Rhodococcus sp. Leaf7]|nr:hypothetical protein ASG56_15705 [Rhodococcus sp. Leaf7]KQU37898.1 hypothetical protein ASG64_18435 [Rhodococcus sp. Leaf247]
MVTDHESFSGPATAGPDVVVPADARRRPVAPRSGVSVGVDTPSTRSEYLTLWSDLHGGYDASSSRMVRGWLTLSYVLARPLARAGVAPNAVTAVGVVFAVIALSTAGAGSWGAGSAALLLIASALVDSLDGAVALLRGRSSAFGYVADSVADRLSDMLAFAILAALGAPVPLVVAVAVLTLLHETARARAVSAGMTSIGVVTVWERPSRVIAVVVTLLGSAMVDDTTVFATIGVGVAVLLAVVGFSQLVVTIHHALRALPAPRPGRTRG